MEEEIKEQTQQEPSEPVVSEVQPPEPAEVQTAPRKRKIGEIFAGYFTATRISYLAVFTALSFILRLPWFEFPVLNAVPFLKIDFSGVFVMIAGFALGPVAGVVVSVLKELIYALSFSQSIGVGELANILIMLPYILIPTILYKKYKGIKAVLISIAIGCAVQVVWSIPVNYLLTFPFYMNLYAHMPWPKGMEFYLTVWYWAVLFNLIKTVLITAATLIIYKPLSKLVKITNEKFTKRKKKETADEQVAEQTENTQTQD